LENLFDKYFIVFVLLFFVFFAVIHHLQKLIFLRKIGEITGNWLIVVVCGFLLLCSASLVRLLEVPFRKLISIFGLHEFVHSHWTPEGGQLQPCFALCSTGIEDHKGTSEHRG